jgi:hypothetical protein
VNARDMTPGDGNVPKDAHPNIWMLVRYWQYIQPPGRLPGRIHFDPIDIPALLPNIRLIDVVDGGPYRYRVRLIGTEHVKQLGYDPTGQWYETVTSRFRNSVVELDLERVRHGTEPVYRKGNTIVPYTSDAKVIERVHVPFASDGHHVDLIASLTLFYPELRPFAGPRPTAKPASDPDGSGSVALPEVELGVGLAAPRPDSARSSPNGRWLLRRPGATSRWRAGPRRRRSRPSSPGAPAC